jgi:hypothetical protein
MPDTVKYGISNLTVMGARRSPSSTGKIRNINCDPDSDSTLDDLRTVFNTWEAKVSPHEKLAASTELFDLPDECGLVGGIGYTACGRLHIRGVRNEYQTR